MSEEPCVTQDLKPSDDQNEKKDENQQPEEDNKKEEIATANLLDTQENRNKCKF